MEAKQKQTARYGVKGDGTGSYRFYMLNPKENCDIKAMADRLISFKEVEEVYITEGAHGFIVKARLEEGKEPKDICDYMARAIDSRFCQATAHLSYRK
jgi:DNA-binding Lrp family transcriptional regulator